MYKPESKDPTPSPHKSDYSKYSSLLYNYLIYKVLKIKKKQSKFFYCTVQFCLQLAFDQAITAWHIPNV